MISSTLNQDYILFLTLLILFNLAAASDTTVHVLPETLPSHDDHSLTGCLLALSLCLLGLLFSYSVLA